MIWRVDGGGKWIFWRFFVYSGGFAFPVVVVWRRRINRGQLQFIGKVLDLVFES